MVLARLRGWLSSTALITPDSQIRRGVWECGSVGDKGQGFVRRHSKQCETEAIYLGPDVQIAYGEEEFDEGQ